MTMLYKSKNIRLQGGRTFTSHLSSTTHSVFAYLVQIGRESSITPALVRFSKSRTDTRFCIGNKGIKYMPFGGA